MNYGLQHRYYAHDLGAAPQTVSLLTPSGGLNYGIPKNLPVIVLPKGPIATPKPVTPIVAADAAPAICLDQSENSISCSDPNCAHGDCGSTAAQITVGALCLDQGENQIDCTDPNCTFGDCVSTSWWSKSSIITGVPDVAIYAVLAMVLFGGGFGAGRRR